MTKYICSEALKLDLCTAVDCKHRYPHEYKYNCGRSICYNPPFEHKVECIPVYNREEIDFNQFHNYMTNIKRSLDTQDRYTEIMTESFLDDMAGYLIDDIINLLEREFNTELISWFVFETEFGLNNNTLSINEKEVNVLSIKDLWYVINKKEK